MHLQFKQTWISECQWGHWEILIRWSLSFLSGPKVYKGQRSQKGMEGHKVI